MSNYVTIHGTRFNLNGRDYPVAGANCYYLGYCPADIPQMAESVLNSARNMALNVMRIWAFLEPSPPPISRDLIPWGGFFQFKDGDLVRQNESTDGLARLDRAIALAEQRGIKLILVLTNSMPDFGGMDQYTKWLARNGTSLFHDAFYDQEDLCQAFEVWIRSLVLRTNLLTGRLYRDEPTILAWELANEPRCHSANGLPARADCTSSGRILNWVQRMSAAVRKLDPNHLIAVGDEGFFKYRVSRNFLYNGSDGFDTRKLLELPTVDFGTFHLYPQCWNQNRAFGRKWIQQHLSLARQVGKPMLLEEYGLSLGDGFVAGAEDRDVLYGEWLNTVAEYNGAGTLFWMLAGTGPHGERFPDADAFCLFSDQDAPSIAANARTFTGATGIVSA